MGFHVDSVHSIDEFFDIIASLKYPVQFLLRFLRPVDYPMRNTANTMDCFLNFFTRLSFSSVQLPPNLCVSVIWLFQWPHHNSWGIPITISSARFSGTIIQRK